MSESQVNEQAANAASLTPKQIFDVWAPADSIWSPWVSPAVFTQIDLTNRGQPYQDKDNFEPTWPESRPPRENAVVIDLPGIRSIRLAMLLAERGYRPIPILNVSPGPDPRETAHPYIVLDMRGLVNELCLATPRLHNISLAPDAPPAFFLDSRRLEGTAPVKDVMFDNRWMVFPQDFPSAAFLTKQKITSVTLVQSKRGQPLEDLSHALMRWQEAGIEILAQDTAGSTSPEKITISRPSRFKAAWYRALAIMGLQRSAAGGFGSFIPTASGGG
jgi:hypothetical protein